MPISSWDYSNRTQTYDFIQDIQNQMYEEALDSKTEFRRLAGVGLVLSDFVLTVVKLTARVAESPIKGIANIFKGIAEGNSRQIIFGATYLFSTPFLAIGSSILLALSVASVPIVLPAHIIWCAVSPESYCEANITGIDWDWSSRTQLIDWINLKEIRMYQSVRNANGDYKKALGLPLFVIERTMDIAKLIAWIVEPIIKGVGNIIAFTFLRECHLLFGVQQLLTSPFLALGTGIIVTVGALILPFEMVLMPLAFLENPDSTCTARINELKRWQ